MTDRRWFSPDEIERAKRLRASGYTFQEIADRMGRTKSAIGKLSRRNWLPHTRGNKPRPMDLGLRIHEMTSKQLQRHYGVGQVQLNAWLAEAGLKLPYRRYEAPVRALPADFAKVAPGKSHKWLQAHYKASGRTVTRWKVEAGVPAPYHDRYLRSIAKPKSIGWAEEHYRQLAMAA